MINYKYTFFILIFLFNTLIVVLSNRDPGKWDFTVSEFNTEIDVSKSLFSESKINFEINCSSTLNTQLQIIWTLTKSKCWQNFDDNNFDVIQTENVTLCGNNKRVEKREENFNVNISNDGFYNFKLSFTPTNNEKFNSLVHIEMKGTYGYLSAEDWPLLPFYGSMFLIYILLMVIWLIVSIIQRRDLLQIQYWIGGVILLGMLEKAFFYIEYECININGSTSSWLVLFAEWVSCLKRTLARMLVIIVSLGLGIVRPKLGSKLHKVVGIGILYFFAAVLESYYRIVNTKKDPVSKIIVASFPLWILDFAIFWWIFVLTTRISRLKGNMIKFTLYRYFTNALIISVILSVIFTLYSIKVHRFTNCVTDWQNLWIDDFFWHVLFSFLLLVIMILLCPTNTNNQKYAFTFLENMEDIEDIIPESVPNEKINQ